MYKNTWEYKAKPSHLKTGLQEINSFFVRMMEHSLSLEAIDEQIAEIIVLLRALLSFAPDEEIRVVRDENYGFARREAFQSEWYEEKLDDRTKWALMLLLKKLAVFHKIVLTKDEDATFQKSLGTNKPYEYQDYLTSEDNYLCKELVAARYEFAYSQLLEIVANPPYELSEEVCERLLAALEQERQRVRAELDRELYRIIYFKNSEGYYATPMILTRREQEDLIFRDFLKSHLSSIISIDDLPEDLRNTDISLQSIYILNMLPRYIEHSRFYPREKIHEQLLLRAKYEVSHVLAFIISLRNAGVALSQNPILLDTGEYKEVPGAQRTKQDMWNEMVEELHDLPPRTAYCRIRKEIAGKQKIFKYKLYPDPPSYVNQEQLRLVAAQTDEIIERTHNLYCTERTKVQDEIIARREYLKKRVERKRETVEQEILGTAPAGKPSLSIDQRKKLSSLRKALGDTDYDLFYNDPLVQQQDNLKRLLDKDVDAEKIRNALEDWRKAGSPSDVSPFADLIKTLLG